jgi:hypothetical protein
MEPAQIAWLISGKKGANIMAAKNEVEPGDLGGLSWKSLNFIAGVGSALMAANWKTKPQTARQGEMSK